MIAVVIVTHNSRKFLEETLNSIEAQSQQPGLKVAVDDNSVDNTQQLLSDHGFTVVAATTPSKDTTTRIAQNFVQGVTAAQELGATTVVLGDHDDTWHPHRIAHQIAQLTAHPTTALLASDGAITPTTTLRSTFPVPSDFNDWDRDHQWSYTAKHSIATGGASALIPANLSTLAIPDGWLHDRWWSLRAVRESAMRTDQTIVIDYRLSGGQQVGLDTRGQGNPVARILHKLQDIPLNVKKMKDIAQLLSDGNN